MNTPWFVIDLGKYKPWFVWTLWALFAGLALIAIGWGAFSVGLTLHHLSGWPVIHSVGMAIAHVYA